MIIKLTVLPDAESTQDVARQMAISGAPEGTAVMALQQRRGRGRFGHSWISPPGKNVALSLVLRPGLVPGEAVLLGLLVAVAVANVVEQCGVSEVGLKWPNDVLVGDGKVAGILSDASLEDGIIQYVIVGVGLNVNAEQSDFPMNFAIQATSLLICTGKQWDVEETARNLLYEVGLLYQRVHREGSEIIPGLWEQRWAHRGRIMVHNGVIGVAQALAPDGALILKSSDGRLTRIVSGEVFAQGS